MKRKFKLFATVASLCLCLALMAFGVYAATTVTYTATGSVKYVVTDVKADFTLKVEKSNTKGTKRDSSATAATLDPSADGSKITWTIHVEETTKKSYDEKGNITNPGGQDPALTDMIGELDFATSDLYKITITVENKASSGSFNATSSISEDLTTGTNAKIVPAEETYSTTREVKSGSTGKTATYVYYVFLLDPGTSISTAVSFSLQVSAVNKTATN